MVCLMFLGYGVIEWWLCICVGCYVLMFVVLLLLVVVGFGVVGSVCVVMNFCVVLVLQMSEMMQVELGVQVLICSVDVCIGEQLKVMVCVYIEGMLLYEGIYDQSVVVFKDMDLMCDVVFVWCVMNVLCYL